MGTSVPVVRPDMRTGHGGGLRTPAGGRDLTIGISGTRRNATVAACDDGVLTACCEQERVTRLRGVRLEPLTLPHEALAAVLHLAGERTPSDVSRYAVAEEAARLPDGLPTESIDHHRAHAASAFLTSPFARAAVVVCDANGAPPQSVWLGSDAGLTRQEWPASAAGFASLYSACAAVFGFAPGQEYRLEALARLDAGQEAGRFERVIRYSAGRLLVADSWIEVVSGWLAAGAASGDGCIRHRARVASAFQQHLGDLLVTMVSQIRSALNDVSDLCLAGGLFYNTALNTRISRSGLFDRVFVAPNPGNAGLAAGAALACSRVEGRRQPNGVSPFLGPQYSPEDIKLTLDNCKLSYAYVSDAELVDTTVDALRRGQLVGWFQGRMEWGHRSLGNRTILASPLMPYALDNLNVFLKQRERHRTYGLSVPADAAHTLFDGPPQSRFMEYDYALVDRQRFRHVLPYEAATLRVQTIAGDDPEASRYLRLHRAFGDASGVPALVNTSFNGFSEPIVCSPRDAIRVFFGTGLDMLVLDRFVVRK